MVWFNARSKTKRRNYFGTLLASVCDISGRGEVVYRTRMKINRPRIENMKLSTRETIYLKFYQRKKKTGMAFNRYLWDALFRPVWATWNVACGTSEVRLGFYVSARSPGLVISISHSRLLHIDGKRRPDENPSGTFW